MSKKAFADQVADLKKEIRNFQDTIGEAVIEQTAARLEGLNYAPPVMIDNARFLRLTKETLLEEINRILAMPDQEACALAPNEPKKCEDLRLQFILVLIYYYKKLMQLRQGDIETWEEVDELYVHD